MPITLPSIKPEMEDVGSKLTITPSSIKLKGKRREVKSCFAKK